MQSMVLKYGHTNYNTMISLSKKFLFIHMPKTAGNSIQNILKPYSEDEIVCRSPLQDGYERFGVENKKYKTKKHFRLIDYKKTIEPEIFNTLFKFTIIRNPWDRMISLYFSPHRKVDSWDKDSFINLVNSSSPLRDFISQNSLAYSIKNLSISKSKLKKFSKDLLAGKISLTKKIIDSEIDFIIKYESLEEDFEKLCKLLSIPKEHLPTANKSLVKKKHYSYYYNEELKKLIENKFSEEIMLGGYVFNHE